MDWTDLQILIHFNSSNYVGTSIIEFYKFKSIHVNLSLTCTNYCELCEI